MPKIEMSRKLNNTSKLASINTEEYVEMFLDADGIIPSKQNFYPTDEIEQLADNMLLVGHLDPLIVGRVNGKAHIISGHRRFKAIQHNISRGYESFKRVRCLGKEMSETMFMLTLISANAFNRVMDDVTLVKQVDEYKKYLSLAVQREEISIEGNLRDYIAKMFGKSSTKIAQVNKINSSLIDEGKQAFKEGKMNFSKAYEVSKLPENEQHMVIANNELLSSDVKAMVQAKKNKMSESDTSKECSEHILPPDTSEQTPVDTKEKYPALTYQEGAERFLENYKCGEKWFDEPRIGAEYYRFKLPDMSYIIAVAYAGEKLKIPHFFFMEKDGSLITEVSRGFLKELVASYEKQEV